MSTNVPPTDEMEHNPHLEISFFRSASNFQINGGTFNAYDPAGDCKRESEGQERRIAAAMEMLAARAEKGAPYDAAAREDVPKCHENTRLAIIDNIMRWAHSTDPDTPPFMWMYGPPGRGKTTIAQTVAETFDEEGCLAASFFFSKLSPERPKEKKDFVISMAHQFAIHRPAVQPYLADILAKDSTILHKALPIQLSALLVGPLSQLDPTEPVVFLVDGLDECEGEESQRLVLDVLSSFSTNVRRGSIRVLISCRPVSGIQTFFSRQQVGETIVTMPLADDYQSFRDISTFLHARFQRIRDEHPAGSKLDPEWPSKIDVDSLVWRSSGQFVYARLTMDFVARSGEHPAVSLKRIRNLKPGDNCTPYGQLDAIYTDIMRTIDPDHLNMVKLVLVCFQPLIDCRGPLITGIMQSLGIADTVFGLDFGTTEARMHTLLLLLCQKHPESQRYRFVHASFGEYLRDPSRSGPFFIDASQIYSDLLFLTIRWFSEDRLLHQSCTFEDDEHDCHMSILRSAAPQQDGAELPCVFEISDVSRSIFVYHNSFGRHSPELDKALHSLNIQELFIPKGSITRWLNFQSVMMWVWWSQIIVWISLANGHRDMRFVGSETYEHIFHHLCSAVETARRIGLIAVPLDELQLLTTLWPQLEQARRPNPNRRYYTTISDTREMSDLSLPMGIIRRDQPCQELFSKVLLAASGGSLNEPGICAVNIALRILQRMDGYNGLLTSVTLPIVLSKASPSLELATAIKRHLLSSHHIGRRSIIRHRSGRDEVLFKKRYTALFIYLHECRLPLIEDHRHPPDYNETKYKCAICHFYGPNAVERELIDDTELSLDPTPVAPGRIAIMRQELPYIRVAPLAHWIRNFILTVVTALLTPLLVFFNY